MNLVQEWEQPIPKDYVAQCLRRGIGADIIDKYGYGELKFILFIRELKVEMNTNRLQRIDRELQEDMVVLEKQEPEGPIIQHIRKVFTCATGHLSRAILRSAQMYEKKHGGKAKRQLNNAVENWHRKKSY